MRAATRVILRTLSLVALLGLAAIGPAVAQSGDPAAEVEIDIPEDTNPVVEAGRHLAAGKSYVTSAEKQLGKAAEENDAKKKAKLDGKAAKAWENAVSEFLAALQYDPGLYDAYTGLATAWSHTGEHDKALQAYGKAAQMNPEDGDVLYGFAECLLELDRPRDAASVYANLAVVDEERAAELLASMKRWGEERAPQGHDEAGQLLEWIAQLDGPTGS